MLLHSSHLIKGMFWFKIKLTGFVKASNETIVVTIIKIKTIKIIPVGFKRVFASAFAINKIQ
jgi:hypothetical protein